MYHVPVNDAEDGGVDRRRVAGWEQPGALISISVEAGERSARGRIPPELNIGLGGFMYHPPHLFGSLTLGDGGRPVGKVEL